MLQNGKIPQFIGEKGLNQIFNEESPSPCYKEIQKAFKEFGIYQVIIFCLHFLCVHFAYYIYFVVIFTKEN